MFILGLRFASKAVQLERRFAKRTGSGLVRSLCQAHNRDDEIRYGELLLRVLVARD